MRRSRTALVGLAGLVATLAVPVLPARADTLVVFTFQEGKAVVQCLNPVTGLTWPMVPFAKGTNKGKKCGYALSTKNAHKVGLPWVGCTAVAVSDALKKGSDKPPVAVGTSKGGLVNNCELTATGVIDRRAAAPLPNPTGGPPIPVGPWCVAWRMQDGAGILKIGPKATPVKTINFDRLRINLQGQVALVTAAAFKDNVDPPAGQLQAGPLVAVFWHPHPGGEDDHKVAGGIAKSSCATNNKNFKVNGVGVALLMGNK